MSTSAPAAVGLEDGREGLGDAHGSEHVDVEDPLDRGDVGRQQRTGTARARVVDDDGDVGEPAGESGDRLVVRHLERDGNEPRVARGLGGARGHVDLRGAAGEQLVGEGLAEAPLASGDEGDGSGEWHSGHDEGPLVR